MKLFVNKLCLLTSSSLLLLFCEMKAQGTYPAFYDAPKESYVKAMKNVFEDLRNRKWEKAQKGYAKVEDKSASAKAKGGYSNTQMQALFPLPQVAKAILLSTIDASVPTLKPDYPKAYYNLKQALTYPQKDKLNAFLSDPDVSVNLNMLEDRIENELCQQASTANTEQAYDSVIDSLLPQSLHMETMLMQRENLVFSTIRKAPTEAECRRFLEKYTNAMPSHKAAISYALDSIRYYALDGTTASLEKYIELYPNSSFTKMAKDTLETRDYMNLQNTAAACRAFMEKYPASKFTMEVKKRYESLAYKEAIAVGTAAAYQQFCKDFPYDLHYQNVFDTLLYRTIKEIYDTVFAGKEPNIEKYLSKAFCTSVQNRISVNQKMLEDGLVPPRQRNIWTGMAQGITTYIQQAQQTAADSVGTWTVDIKDVDMKSKTNASVHIFLTGPSTQSDIFLDFIFEGSALKIDDIRLDNGQTSQKNGGM